MLYMNKTRVTYRIAPDLAASLRALPNQTQFVEDALRDALGAECPLCDGSGRLPTHPLRVSNFKRQGLPRLKRRRALQLRGVVRLARQMAATDLRLQPIDGAIGFMLTRDREVLLRGSIRGSGTELRPN
jgi:hypothetical protein